MVGIATVEVRRASNGTLLAHGTFLNSSGIFVSADHTNGGVGFGSQGVPFGDAGFPGQPVYPFGLGNLTPAAAVTLKKNTTVTGAFVASCLGFPVANVSSCGAPTPLFTTAGGSGPRRQPRGRGTGRNLQGAQAVGAPPVTSGSGSSPTTFSSSPSHSAIRDTFRTTSGQVRPEQFSTRSARNRRMRCDPSERPPGARAPAPRRRRRAARAASAASRPGGRTARAPSAPARPPPARAAPRTSRVRAVPSSPGRGSRRCEGS